VKPKVVRGPEIVSCVLGESEKMRDLCEDARHDQQNLETNTKLHVIVFNEIDGMIYLVNILLIGTTNILEAIDPALLRPGRIETISKIELRNITARSNIFDIHTKALIRNGALNQDVHINNIIRRTEGMSGAHVERVVRLAIQAAMRRDIVDRDKFDITEEEAEDLEVCNQDFIEALSKISA
jgi:SpoVK/Ycf46/Vps4 family AAA+-type ATPase